MSQVCSSWPLVLSHHLVHFLSAFREIKFLYPVTISTLHFYPYALLTSYYDFQAHVYYKTSNDCAAFLANYDSNSDASVTFNGKSYFLPAWSVSILPDCKNVIFNTAKVQQNSFFFKMILLSLSSHVEIPFC